MLIRGLGPRDLGPQFVPNKELRVEPLKKNPAWKGRKGPVVLVIMDGVGYGAYTEGDAVAA
ncbi:MAG: hypothetical protein LBQ35_07565, partial [Spirochaetaceae bacterium]|nr:hypothetical protein [Spirochaetaceae bacterium]